MSKKTIKIDFNKISDKESKDLSKQKKKFLFYNVVNGIGYHHYEILKK